MNLQAAKAAFLCGITAAYFASCSSRTGRFPDPAAKGIEAVYEDIFPEKTNGKDFYTLYCWEVHPEKDKEVRFDIPELTNKEPYEKLPFYNVIFQDTLGRPCRLSAFAREDTEVQSEPYLQLFTHVPPQEQIFGLDCSKERLKIPDESVLYSVADFQDSADNKCTFIFKERKGTQPRSGEKDL